MACPRPVGCLPVRLGAEDGLALQACQSDLQQWQKRLTHPAPLRPCMRKTVLLVLHPPHPSRDGWEFDAWNKQKSRNKDLSPAAFGFRFRYNKQYLVSNLLVVRISGPLPSWYHPTTRGTTTTSLHTRATGQIHKINTTERRCTYHDGCTDCYTHAFHIKRQKFCRAFALFLHGGNQYNRCRAERRRSIESAPKKQNVATSKTTFYRGISSKG